MVRWLGVVGALALVVTSSVEARAQMGFARGEVVDEKGSPVAGAKVRLDFLGEQERQYTTKTDDKGRYAQGVPSGRYRITVSKDGYQGSYLDQAISSGSPTEVPTLKIVSREEVVQEAMAPVLKRFDEAAALLGAGKLDEAIAVYRELEAEHPDMPEVHFNLGTVYVRQEEWPEAEAALQKTLELQPDNKRARVLLATVHEKMGRPQEALAAIEKLSAENPDDPRLHYEIGVLHLNAHRYDEAFAAFDEVRKLDASNVDVLYLLGTISLNLSHVDEAVGYLESYLQKAPENGQHRATASDLLSKLRRNEPAP